jgi:hypothetical protein
MGSIAHTRGSSVFSDPLDISFMMLHRSSYSIIKEIQLKSVSQVAEGKITLPLSIYTLIFDINTFLGE